MNVKSIFNYYYIPFKCTWVQHVLMFDHILFITIGGIFMEKYTIIISNTIVYSLKIISTIGYSITILSMNRTFSK